MSLVDARAAFEADGDVTFYNQDGEETRFTRAAR